jgi:hypothetical protein
MVFIPSAYSARPVIYSKFTSTPPIIDGVFTQGDTWTTNLQITMLEPEYPITAYVYILNDEDYLYFLVDAAGDTTNGESDECLLVFNFNPPYIKVQVKGQGGDHTSGLPYDGVIGYDSSPNSANSHKIYEFRILWAYIGISAGQPIDFSSPPWKSVSMPYDGGGDGSPSRDNVWPKSLVVEEIETWPMLYTAASGPVGGVMEPVNTFALISPWLAVIGLVGCIGTVVVVAKKRQSQV